MFYFVRLLLDSISIYPNYIRMSVGDAKCTVVTAVCVSVPCHIPRLLNGPGGMVEGALLLCIIGRICNRCTAFVAVTT